MNTRAVLTGDLIKSSALNDASMAEARRRLAQAVQDIANWGPGLVEGNLDIFRGDSWQLLLKKPAFCLRAAILLRAALREGGEGWDTRIAIGAGRVEQVDKTRISLSTGEAFTLSGRALDAMGSSANMVIALSERLQRYVGLEPLTLVCGSVIDDWTARQAEVARLALDPRAPSQMAIASRLGVTQQAVSKALASAKLPALLKAIYYCEQLKWQEGARWV